MTKQWHLRKCDAAVRRGVRLLDKMSPGWHLKIDLRKLDLAFIDKCVLGQVFGDYSDGCDKLSDALTEARIQFTRAYPADSRIDPEHYGFDVSVPDASYEAGINGSMLYSRLTERWAEVIRKRTLS